MSYQGESWSPNYGWNPLPTVTAKENSLTALRTAVGPGVLQNPEQVWNMLKGRDPAFTPVDLGDFYYIANHLSAHW